MGAEQSLIDEESTNIPINSDSARGKQSELRYLLKKDYQKEMEKFDKKSPLHPKPRLSSPLKNIES